MNSEQPLSETFEWQGDTIPLGSSVDTQFAVGESYSGHTTSIPVHIRRASKPGPVVFVSAALHGDEINGIGAIREILQDNDKFALTRGTLILIPVVNVLGFERHSRYLPDRRDLNRAFPGSESGSLSGRFARKFFDEVVMRSNYGIDIHTAAVRRTNYPNIRGDLSCPTVRRLASAFGCELILDGVGPAGSLRREACNAGCPTIVMEGGEVSKVEPSIVESALRGISSVLNELEMLDCEQESPGYQLTIKSSKWVRAERGGFLQFHVKPGELLEKGQPIATNANLLGREQNVIVSPFNAVVIGMTTLPAISPGDPICNLGKLPRGQKPEELARLRKNEGGLEQRLVRQLASNVLVVDPSEPDSE